MDGCKGWAKKGREEFISKRLVVVVLSNGIKSNEFYRNSRKT